jgi:hypothetical protein
VRFGVEIMTVISTHYVCNVVAISRCKHGDGANLLRLHSMRLMLEGSRDSSVGIATRYGLDGPGIESRWGARFSPPVQTGPGAHIASYTMSTGSFPGEKRWRSVDHPPSI